MTGRVVVRLLPILGQCVCERVTQPIRLVLPDLLKDRLAKVTGHAAHVDMIIGVERVVKCAHHLVEPLCPLRNVLRRLAVLTIIFFDQLPRRYVSQLVMVWCSTMRGALRYCDLV